MAANTLANLLTLSFRAKVLNMIGMDQLEDLVSGKREDCLGLNLLALVTSLFIKIPH